VSEKRSPSARSRSEAAINKGRPFCAERRATQTNSVKLAATGSAAASRNSRSRPHRTMPILSQWSGLLQRISWLRPKLLMAATKLAAPTFAGKERVTGASNSSGP